MTDKSEDECPVMHGAMTTNKEEGNFNKRLVAKSAEPQIFASA
jgi:hypothetical protein